MLTVDPYFLGPFVYYDEDARIRFLVDGQQRFTTLHLIFLHLRRLAVEYGEEETARSLDHLAVRYSAGGAQFRIGVDAGERRPLLRALHDGGRYRVPLGASLSLRNLAERSDDVGELLRARLHDDALPRFVDWLLDRVVMVGIKAFSRNHGFRIFESMNDRGARLTAVDLVKSFLLANAGGQQADLNDGWRRMLSQLTSTRRDPDTPRRFLQHLLIARYADLGEGESSDRRLIAENLNGWVRAHPEKLDLRNEDDYTAFMAHLTTMADHYQWLVAARGPRAGS